jgi:hypothetical protein
MVQVSRELSGLFFYDDGALSSDWNRLFSGDVKGDGLNRRVIGLDK